jgi:hypothetical protein
MPVCTTSCMRQPFPGRSVRARRSSRKGPQGGTSVRTRIHALSHARPVRALIPQDRTESTRRRREQSGRRSHQRRPRAKARLKSSHQQSGDQGARWALARQADLEHERQVTGRSRSGTRCTVHRSAGCASSSLPASVSNVARTTGTRRSASRVERAGAMPRAARSGRTAYGAGLRCSRSRPPRPRGRVGTTISAAPRSAARGRPGAAVLPHTISSTLSNSYRGRARRCLGTGAGRPGTVVESTGCTALRAPDLLDRRAGEELRRREAVVGREHPAHATVGGRGST